MNDRIKELKTINFPFAELQTKNYKLS